MIAGQRQPGQDGLRRSGRLDPARRQLVAHDAIVGLGVKVAFVDGDSGSSCVALRLGWTKADDLIGPAIAFGILQRYQKSARWRRVVVEIATAPGIGVDDPVRSYREMPGMAQLVREDSCAKTWRQCDAAIIRGAGVRCRRRRRLAGGLSVGPCCGRNQQSREEDCQGIYRPFCYKVCTRLHSCRLPWDSDSDGASCERSSSSLAPDRPERAGNIATGAAGACRLRRSGSFLAKPIKRRRF